MYATYYDRTFPVDHDMALVRERVVEEIGRAHV